MKYEYSVMTTGFSHLSPYNTLGNEETALRQAGMRDQYEKGGQCHE
jgi:hypothetical protein